MAEHRSVAKKVERAKRRAEQLMAKVREGRGETAPHPTRPSATMIMGSDATFLGSPDMPPVRPGDLQKAMHLLVLLLGGVAVPEEQKKPSEG